MKLAGKKALITGGNSGIGLATASLFISEGAEVAISGRDQQTLDEAVAELGSKAHGYRADVTVAEDRKRLFADLAKDFSKLDIVFANAGISGSTPTGAADEAIFEQIIHTNLSGAFFIVNSAAPLMNDNGSVIFNGSVQNYLGQPGLAAYAATKGGLRLDGAIHRGRPGAAQDSRERGGPGSDKDSDLETRGAGQRHGGGIRKNFRLLLFHRSTCPLGRTGRSGQGCAFSCLGRFVLHQRGGADRGWRTDGRSLRSPHSSRLTVERSEWNVRTNRRQVAKSLRVR